MSQTELLRASDALSQVESLLHITGLAAEGLNGDDRDAFAAQISVIDSRLQVAKAHLEAFRNGLSAVEARS